MCNNPARASAESITSLCVYAVVCRKIAVEGLHLERVIFCVQVYIFMSYMSTLNNEATRDKERVCVFDAAFAKLLWPLVTLFLPLPPIVAVTVLRD